MSQNSLASRSGSTQYPGEARFPQALIKRITDLGGRGETAGARRLFERLEEVVGPEEASVLALERRVSFTAAAVLPDARKHNIFTLTPPPRYGFCR